MTPPNMRLKLSARGGRLIGKGSVLIAARRRPQLKRDPLGRATSRTSHAKADIP